MVQFCYAYGCSASSDVDQNVMIRKFPDAVKDKERHLKWINALKRNYFKPSSGSKLCSSPLKPSDYDPPVICGPPRLLKNALPSIFNFPDNLIPKQVPERRLIKRHIPDAEPESSQIWDSNSIREDVNCLSFIKKEKINESFTNFLRITFRTSE